MMVVLLSLYFAGFGGTFVIATVFDGGFGSKKDGPVVNFIGAALWPLIAVVFICMAIKAAIFK